MSVQGEITEYLQSLAPDETTGYIPATAESIADKTGQSREKVNKTLYNLMTRGKIELVRAANGRHIIGFRNISGNGTRPKTERVKPDTGRVRQAEPVRVEAGQQRPRTIATPMLDEYQTAKSIFDRTVERLGPLMTAEFKTNPYAEEGLRLRDRLATLEPQYSEMARELEQANRDLRALRREHQNDMAADAIKRGAVATHGD